MRDVVGHLVDTTESYLPAFEIARTRGTAPEPLGLRVMARRVDEAAKAFRKVPQDELVDRLHDDAKQMMAEFSALTDADYSGSTVPHTYMGPVPAMFYPIFQLVDYAVHSWDIRQGIGSRTGWRAIRPTRCAAHLRAVGRDEYTSAVEQAVFDRNTREWEQRRSTCVPMCRPRVCSSRPVTFSHCAAIHRRSTRNACSHCVRAHERRHRAR